MLRNPSAGLALARPEHDRAGRRQGRRQRIPTRDAVDALAVSELSHVTEEARVFMALGHNDRAIEVLHDHIRRLPRSMPAAWLMLLDLYHATGKRPEFRKLAEDFHAHFNVQAPLWEAFAADEVRRPAASKAFPHIEQQVVELWRKPGCRAYLERLLYDNREGRRNGFPLSTYADILLLLQVLDAPAEVDIDGDLAAAGKLDAEAAGDSRRRRGAAPSRARRPMPPEPRGFAPDAAAHPLRDRAAGHRKPEEVVGGSRRRPRDRAARGVRARARPSRDGPRGAPSRRPSDRASP